MAFSHPQMPYMLGMNDPHSPLASRPNMPMSMGQHMGPLTSMLMGAQPPMQQGNPMGSAAGTALGTAAGAAIGNALLPGAGGYIGGSIGGQAGGAAGGK